MGTALSTQATTEAPGVRQEEAAYAPPRMYLRWRPVMTDWEIDTGGRVPELVVAQGDLTECEADAIVNPANSSLDHAGGAAAAIRHKGGRVIDDESQRWIDANKWLPVGHAMVTTSGRLPCRYVIHTVGPRIHSSQPTAEEAQQLRGAVKSALLEAERLGLASIALPGISSGIFGYPRDLAAQEIVQECVRFCRDRGTSMDCHGQTTLTTIVFLNVDLPTCKSFAQALQDAANEDGKGRTSPGSPRATVLMDATATATNAVRKQECDQRVAPRNPSSGLLLARVGEKDFEVLLGVEFRLFRSKLVTVVGTREETRRVAILEPRRANAISLCKRVSEERGLAPGFEVGYTIGRGESNAQMGVTRLEYMTHGLFVQLARDVDQLLSNYCAVIVDEAHERSVDVDLSLALLQRALDRERVNQAGSTQQPMRFRVIVTSATIGGEATKFQKYLDPSMAHSAVFRVHGRTFPVHIQHRDDIQVDRQEVGSASVGKILSSAAIQSAVELLRTTESGNILVFLPGESCINDALNVARSEISMSATIEVLDTFSSSSSGGFCFRLSTMADEDEKAEHHKTPENDDRGSNHRPDGSKRRVTTTCVVGFHSKVSRAERDRVLYPRCSHWRLVIFATNIAETGVTVPNVRYVIDTGLERRVRWNSDLDMNEMVTEPVSRSSMEQRAGRAGRTASGICVRLFPEAPVGESIQPDIVPAVQNTMIYKAVLLNKQLENQGEPSLELLDPIALDASARAERRLVDLGALDGKHGKLTREGIALLRIGVDLRLGRFLIACARFNCLASGVKLASLLVAADAPERLLPGRKGSLRTDRLRPLIDPSGDHLTLLNILEAYEHAERQGRGMSWSRDMGFDFDVFVDAEASREYLLKILDTLQFPLLDDDDTMQLHGGKEACLRRALCAAFYDQLARPRMAATVKNGFTRVIDGSTSLKMHKEATGRGATAQDEGGPLDNVQVRDGDQANTAKDAEPVVKLGNNSTFWLPETSAGLATPNHLVVFGSLILTDSSTRGEPTVQLVTAVSQEDVKAGAPEWCRIVDFDQLLRSSARETLEYDLVRGMRQTLLMNHGTWLKQLKRASGSTVVGTVLKDKLVVSCPRRSQARVDYYVRKQLQAVAPESVVLQLVDHVSMGKLIGKGGHQIKLLKQNLESLLTSESRGAGHEHTRAQVLTVDTDNKTLTITLQGASKPLMGVVVGRVQSAIVEFLGNETLPLVLDASGERGQLMQRYPRLVQLLNRVPPTAWATRDDVMLQVAHTLVWKCNASIHGGFLRDWVVRGDAANDIDVQLAPPLTTAASIEQGLVQFMAMSDGSKSKTLRIVKKGNKGAAFTLTLGGTGLAPFDIDLVDREQLKDIIAPPGVDCDAGNLLLNRHSALCKKIESAGKTLSAALENVQQKRFVFFYPLDPRSGHHAMSLRRLKLYLSRGWTCVSPVPRAVQRASLTETERALICPDADPSP